MKDQGVTDVYKYTKPTEDGKSRTPTGKMILTFDLYRLPSTVDVAWYKCKVEHYIPSPMRCKNCQLLGHTKNRCKGNTTCPDCSLPPHTPEKCTRIFCINCSGDHSSADNKCPRFVQMREILKIKTENYCSLAEARRQYRVNNPVKVINKNSYAGITSNTAVNLLESVSTNTSKSTSSVQTKKITDHSVINPNQSIEYTNRIVTPPTNPIKEKTTKINTSVTNELNYNNTQNKIKNNTIKTMNMSSETHNTMLISPIPHSKTTSKNADIELGILSDEDSPGTSYSLVKANNKDNTPKSPSEFNSDNPLSPISQLTQSLINKNYYFVTLSDDESLCDFNMEQTKMQTPKA